MDCHILTVVKGLKYCSVLTDKAEEKVSDSDSASTTSEGVEASAGKPKKNRCLACNKKVGLTGKLYLIVYAEQIQSLVFAPSFNILCSPGLVASPYQLLLLTNLGQIITSVLGLYSIAFRRTGQILETKNDMGSSPR